jgi:hypothetical protein
MLWVCRLQHRLIVINNGPGIYLLNLFLAFLQPKYDPALSQNSASNDADEDEDVMPSLPTQKEDEFRPFIRKLPEFKFWSVFIICFIGCTLP